MIIFSILFCILLLHPVFAAWLYVFPLLIIASHAVLKYRDAPLNQKEIELFAKKCFSQMAKEEKLATVSDVDTKIKIQRYKDGKGKAFESEIEEVYHERNWNVKRYEYNDLYNKIDLMCTKGDKIDLVQCKSYNKRSDFFITINEVEEIYGAIDAYIEKRKLRDKYKYVTIRLVINSLDTLKKDDMDSIVKKIEALNKKSTVKFYYNTPLGLKKHI